MIRAFVGILVPADVASMLEAAQVGLPCGSPVLRENFHVTLAFLGEHQEPVIEEVHGLLDAIRATPVEIAIAGLGVFGERRPRLLYADVAASSELKALRKSVRAAAGDAGIALAHERYHPHVTLARFGKSFIEDDRASLQAYLSRRIGRVEGRYVAESFALYESRLGKNGPIYEVLAEYPLEE